MLIYLLIGIASHLLWDSFTHRAVLIIVFILGMKKYPVVTESGRKDYWLVTILAALAVIAMRFLLKPSDFSVGNLIVTSIAGILLGVIVSSLVDLSYKPKQKAR